MNKVSVSSRIKVNGGYYARKKYKAILLVKHLSETAANGGNNSVYKSKSAAHLL